MNHFAVYQKLKQYYKSTIYFNLKKSNLRFCCLQYTVILRKILSFVS